LTAPLLFYFLLSFSLSNLTALFAAFLIVDKWRFFTPFYLSKAVFLAFAL
jgi:hypothetical protein